MTFLKPGYLALSSLSLLLLLLHMVRVRRRRVVVSSNLLWRLTTLDKTTSKALKRLIPSLLLLLQIAMLVLLSISLSRPVSSVLKANAKKTVIIIDISASMGATDISPNRLAAALKKVASIMEKENAFTIITAGSEPSVLAKNINRSEALKILNKVKPGTTSADMDSALSLAYATASSSKDEVVVVTDAEMVNAPVGVVRPSDNANIADNLAVSTFDIRRNMGETGYRWMATIRNFSSSQSKARARLVVDGILTYDKTLTIPANGRIVVPENTGVEPIATPRNEAVKATFTISALDAKRDRLDLDNSAYLVLQPSALARVAVVRNSGSSEESSIIKALTLVPNIKLSVYSKDSSLPQGMADLTIYENFSPTARPQGSSVIIGSLPSFAAISSNGNKNQPTEAVDWDRTHPLLRFVDLTGIVFNSYHVHVPIPGTNTVVEGSDSPLIEELINGGDRTLVLSFNLTDTNFPSQPVFPIFVANLVSWAMEAKERKEQPLSIGSVVDATTYDKQNTTKLELIDPRGSKVDGQGAWRVLFPGFYSLVHDKTEQPIAVNFGIQEESDLKHQTYQLKKIPSSIETNNTKNEGNANTAKKTAAVMWRPFTLVALLLLVVEWALFTMRRLGSFPLRRKVS